jgi:hypothetical protein
MKETDMPPAKKSTRKPARKTTKRPAKKATRKAAKRPSQRKRKLTAAHKRALAEGRTISSTVNAYLSAVNTPRKRGRKVSRASLEQRLTAARARVKMATGVERVVTAQEVRDLQAKLAQASAASGVDVKSLEAAFVKVAKKFGENRGIGYGAWRDAGVSAQVLKRAGIARTRG